MAAKASLYCLTVTQLVKFKGMPESSKLYTKIKIWMYRGMNKDLQPVGHFIKAPPPLQTTFFFELLNFLITLNPCKRNSQQSHVSGTAMTRGTSTSKSKLKIQPDRLQALSTIVQQQHFSQKDPQNANPNSPRQNFSEHQLRMLINRNSWERSSPFRPVLQWAREKHWILK